MKTAVAKERTTKYGFKYLTYKVDRKIVVEIAYPNEFTPGFRTQGRGWCHGIHSTIETCKADAEAFLRGFYSIFGGIDIIYC